MLLTDSTFSFSFVATPVSMIDREPRPPMFPVTPTEPSRASNLLPHLSAIFENTQDAIWSVDTERHKQVVRKHPGLRQAGESEKRLIEDLSRIAREHGIELRSCSNPESKLPTATCCGIELFDCYGIGEKLLALGAGPSRTGCQCLKTLDIGMDNTCPGGCVYCYVTNAPGTVAKNVQSHSPASVRMR